MPTQVLDVIDVSFSYGATRVLDRISFSTIPGGITCLLGPSGSGKTTLLRSIAGFETIKDGSIRISGQTVANPLVHLPPNERGIGFVFQDYSLFPHLTVAENICFGLNEKPKAIRREILNQLLHTFGLSTLSTRKPNQLSGGQQQRVAIARALARHPSLLLLDEPFSHLDPSLRNNMKAELRDLLTKLKVTALMVTHDQEEAFDIADNIVLLNEGRIEQIGTPYELYHQPKTRFTASFIGSGAFLPVTSTKNHTLTTELGSLTIDPALLETSEGKSLEIFLRPDDLYLDETSAIRAIIRNVAFRGMFVIYALTLSSGREILCFSSSHRLHRRGEDVGVRLDVEHPVLVPVNT